MSDIDQRSTASTSEKSGKAGRPLPVYLLTVACMAPAVAIAVIIAFEPSIAVWPLQYGTTESVIFITGLIFALVLAAAGVFLYLQRRLSIWLLYACLPWCVFRAAAGPPVIYGAAIFGLAIALALVYASRLNRRALLS